MPETEDDDLRPLTVSDLVALLDEAGLPGDTEMAIVRRGDSPSESMAFAWDASTTKGVDDPPRLIIYLAEGTPL